MLRFHKEGKQTIFITIALLAALNIASLWASTTLQAVIIAFSIFMLYMILQFFRNPIRKVQMIADNIIYAPADGKVVVIEEAVETEYFNDKRIQISIFMSPLNVHVNRNPISGNVEYSKYHPGKYLVAWHPKSSTENERTTIVIKNASGELLMRQIAGAMAKRIVNYLGKGEKVTQGEDMGFIKFGSRVDLYLPLETKINVKIKDQVKGNLTVIGHFS